MKDTYVKIGFWASAAEPSLPTPIPNTARRDQIAVADALKEVMATGRKNTFRGWSTCRICGQPNGSAELEIRRGSVIYLIPEGYHHYLKVHSVGYDLNLLKALKS